MEGAEETARWLETEAAQRLLNKLARKIYFVLAESNIRPPFMETPARRPEDALPVLQSELILFILEDRANIRALIAARDPNLPRYLQQAFLNRCRDLARRSGLDPLRHFRRRAADVFRQSPEIHRELKDGKFLMFSLHPENEEIRLPADFELCAIGLPRHLAQGLDYAAACKKANLIDLADHFWKRLSSLLGDRRLWVDLRDFVNWVACYVPMQGGIEAKIDEESPGGPGYGDPVAEEMPACDANPLPPPTDGQLEALAAAFVKRVDRKDQEVFYCRWFEALSWKEIARRTGFRGASGPSYRFEEAKAILKGLLREWPGLSPEDEDPETINRFLGKLESVLKKSLAAP